MKRVTIQGECALGLRLFHIQPFGSSLFCEMCGNQSIKTGGSMAFGWGSDSSEARDVDVAVLTKRLKVTGFDLRYYMPSVRKTAFGLPRYIEKLLP